MRELVHDEPVEEGELVVALGELVQHGGAGGHADADGWDVHGYVGVQGNDAQVKGQSDDRALPVVEDACAVDCGGLESELHENVPHYDDDDDDEVHEGVGAGKTDELERAVQIHLSQADPCHLDAVVDGGQLQQQETETVARYHHMT